MTFRLSRRCFTCTLLPAALFSAVPPAWGQEDVLTQTNEGRGTYWLPIIAALYAKPEQGEPVWPEGDGPPVFPEDIIAPPMHFTLNPSPADSAPTIDTDWVVLQKRLQNGEHASAWAVAREFGKPRIWVHRNFNEEYLAGYPESHRVYVVLRVEVVRESFPIAGQLAIPARKQLIRNHVRIATGEMQVVALNGVRKNGSGGSPEETPLAAAHFDNSTLEEIGQRGPLEFIPRFETTASGELLNGVIGVTVNLELEAGTELGLEAPERKKLSGEIRFAVGKQYLDIAKLSGGGEKKN